MKRSLAIALLLAGSASVAQAVSFNGEYYQDFNSMGTGTSAPTDWRFFALTGGHSTFRIGHAVEPGTVLPSATPTSIAGGTQNATLIVQNNPTNQRGSQGYNFGLTSSVNDRALGTSPSNIAASILQLTLTNDTGLVLDGLKISYDIRRFSTTTNNNTSYNNTPVRGIEELPGYWLFFSLNNGSTWTNVSALNPTLAGPDGVIVPNSIGVTNVPVTTFSLGGNWQPGSNLLFRWVDDNAQSPSPDQLLGLDNVRIAVIPEPASFALLALGAGAMLLRRKH